MPLVQNCLQFGASPPEVNGFAGTWLKSRNITGADIKLEYGLDS